MYAFRDVLGKRKRAAIDKLAKKVDCDIVIGSSPEHFPFISNAFLANLTYNRGRPAFACVDQDGRGFILMLSGDISVVQRQTWMDDVFGYREFHEEPIDVLARLLAERGFSESRIGLDLDFLPANSYLRLKELLPRATLVDTFHLVAAARVIKEQDEVATLESAAKATHEAVIEAFRNSRVGDTERQVNTRILQGCLARGARSFHFATFGSGENSKTNHCYATDTVIEDSVFVRCDIGPRFGAWMGDLARVYCSSRPTQAQHDLYNSMLELQEEMIAAIKPGAIMGDLYDLLVHGAAARNLDFDHPLAGHSFGLELHEAPMVRLGERAEIQPGMVLNIEPIVRDKNGFRVHTEDLVEVTESGTRLLTFGLTPRKIPVFGEEIAL